MFTDQQLAAAMSTNLVDADVMTRRQRDRLLDNHTENDVREAGVHVDNFQLYWNRLGNWMAGNGGDINETTGLNVPGRQGGNPQGLGVKPLYNDAFKDVNEWIGKPQFSKVKALSNQLRFIDVLG